MGAYTFETFAEGEDMQEAFVAARDQAQYDHGHAGYTGTIAEKGSVTLIQSDPLSRLGARDLANKLIADCDPRIADKWGPAGALRVVDKDHDGWLFFGWASS